MTIKLSKGITISGLIKSYIQTVSNVIGDWSTATEEQKLSASDAAAGAQFGRSVALSSDGNTAIIGADSEDSNGSTAGAAYVFTRTGGTWTEEQKLVSTDIATLDRFGSAVDISSDGNTAIIGAWSVDSGVDTGAAYIFTRSGSVWTQQQKIEASNKGAGDRFGHSVAISGDGNNVIVGAPFEDTGGSGAGSAYIFTRSGVTWTEQQRIQSSDAASPDNFGWSVSMSSNGDSAIVGAYNKGEFGGVAGSAYIFTRSGSVWSQQQKIVSSDINAADRFGWSVDMSEDGNSVVVGAEAADTGGVNYGAAYIFTLTGGTWVEEQKITASDREAFDKFGVSVSISSAGDVIIVGADEEDTGFTEAGAAYIFTKTGGTWTEQIKIQASDKSLNSLFGVSVAISGDGNTAIAGAYGTAFGNSEGAAYIFNAS